MSFACRSIVTVAMESAISVLTYVASFMGARCGGGRETEKGS